MILRGKAVPPTLCERLQVVTKSSPPMSGRFERFTLRVTGSNTAYAANLVGKPRIVFDRTRVYVQGTQYTDVVGGNRWFNLPDQELWPGEASSVNVELVATSEIAGFLADLFTQERIANVWIRADLDQDRFFQIWNYQEFREEIEPT